MPKLNIIVCSTRPTRAGLPIAEWLHSFARDHGGFDCELVDLATFNLPVFDEPEHPRLQKYKHEHTKRWSASVASADAFVFVTPEYNHGAPPALINALNYLNREWQYKPAGLVSYGGVSGGLRAVQAEKLAFTSLKMVPIVEGVIIPNFVQHIGEDKIFRPNDLHVESARVMLNELIRWSRALAPLRG